MNIPTYAFALPALLCGLSAAPADAQTPTNKQDPKTAIAVESHKPALMAWNRKRLFLIVNKDGQRLGELTDFVIDRTTGRLSHTALRISDESGQGDVIATKALPVSELRWDAETQRFRSLLSRRAIADLPEFSPKWLTRLEQGTKQVVEAGHTRQEKKDAETRRFVLAGDIEGQKVEAKDGSVGAGLGIVIDMNPGEAAYLLLSSGEHRGGELHPVPWNALAPTETGGYAIDRLKAQMADAPSISKELIASLTMPSFRVEVADFYGVPSLIDERLAAQ
jgi:hypothetical protein